MKLKLLNIVVFAEMYRELSAWYAEALGLEVLHEATEDYHYTELGINGHVVVGIASAKEMNHIPISPRNNSSIMQIEVSNIADFFTRIKDSGGTILFGPTFEEKNNFYYGGVADIEGNQIWVVENKYNNIS